MLGLEHLHANALLVVLLGGALAIASLRAAVYLLHRSLVATDRKILQSLARAPIAHFDVSLASEGTARISAELQTIELTQPYQDTPTSHDSES